MRSGQNGFSVIEGLLIVAVVAVIGASGYLLYQSHHKPTKTVTATKVTPAVGTTESIDSLTAQDASSEAAIDAKHSAAETSAAQSANTAAANIGGGYNESSL